MQGLKPRTSLLNKTSGWRVFRPVIDAEKCSGCGNCAMVCPDGVIFQGEKKNKAGKNIYQIDYNFCKGCGICAAECPAKAITMKIETK